MTGWDMVFIFGRIVLPEPKMLWCNVANLSILNDIQRLIVLTVKTGPAL